jgi:hypothetical protein
VAIVFVEVHCTASTIIGREVQYFAMSAPFSPHCTAAFATKLSRSRQLFGKPFAGQRSKCIPGLDPSAMQAQDRFALAINFD